MKVKLIDVLNMIAKDELKQDERVIIDIYLFYYNTEKKRLYKAPSYRADVTKAVYYDDIETCNLDTECELLDRMDRPKTVNYIKS